MFRPTIFILLAIGLMNTPAGAQTSPDPCVATPTTLCLNNNRFQVEVEWFDDAGNDSTVSDFPAGGMARNTPISDVWTGMWFFDPDNLEMLIHVFQGCTFNDRYWVFAAGLTNVEVTLTVTDTATGEAQQFFNPLGQPFAPITDTEAFATCPKSLAQQAHLAPVVPAPVTEGSCSDSATQVCLQDGRFETSMTAFGAPVEAQRLADGTAGFLFGNPSFFDVLVTILDGSSANGQYWVNYSLFPGTADFTLTIRDTLDGSTRTYPYSAASDPLFVLDKTAFQGDDFLAVDGTLAGSWFADEKDGEGFIFDIVELGGVPTLVLYYFTYENNSSGRQAWLVGSAPIIGNKASVPVIIADGAQFGAGFDPASVKRTDWGNVKVTFQSCDQVRVESNSTLFPSVDYVAGRLTPAPTGVQGVCAATKTVEAGVVPQPAGTLTIDGGYGGSWYQPTRDGEGFIFNIAEFNGVNTLVVFYFTYENNSSGRQAWLVGSAPIVGNSADVPMVIASGAQFGDPFDPDDVTRTPWGNVRVTWQGCNQASVEVTSTSFGDVGFDIIPLTPPTIGSGGDCAAP